MHMTKMVMPNCLHISELAFFNCTELEIVDFSEKKDDKIIPTLVDVNAFMGENGQLLPKVKIIVPDGLYERWIAAENWVVLKDRIYRKGQIS